MSVLRKVKVNLQPPVLLNEDGFADMIGHLQGAFATGDDGGSVYLCRSVTMEIEPADEPAEEAADQTAE